MICYDNRQAKGHQHADISARLVNGLLLGELRHKYGTLTYGKVAVASPVG